METIFLILGGFGVFSVPIVLLALATRKKKRPENKIEKLGVHFTPNSTYTNQELEKAIEAFSAAWLIAYPGHAKNLKRALGKLDIIWYTRRIKFQEDYVLALMETTDKIHLWIGPRLKDGKRHLAYTGLLDQLGKLALIVNGLDPDTNRPEVRKILADARSKMF